MPEAPIDLLRCPSCQGGLDLARETWTFTCRGCGATFRASNGAPSFLVPRMSNFFQKQWSLWAKGAFGREIYGMAPSDRFHSILGTLRLEERDLAGKRVLDAGTGHGEVARAFARNGATVIGIDLTSAAFHRHERELSQEGGRPLFVLADYLYCPFAPETFDVIVSSGVVHHTEEPLVALASILRYLKKGGLAYIYIYEPGVPKYLALRKLFPLSHAYPREVLHAISLGLAPLGWAAKRAIGSGTPSLGAVALGVHDALVPRYAFELEPEVVLAMLRDAGFHEAERVAPCEYRAKK